MEGREGKGSIIPKLNMTKSTSPAAVNNLRTSPVSNASPSTM